jgi:hypothetical protein
MIHINLNLEKKVNLKVIIIQKRKKTLRRFLQDQIIERIINYLKKENL